MVFAMRGQETYFETAIFILRSAFVYIVFRVRELSKNAFTLTLYALSFFGNYRRRYHARCLMY